MGFFDNVIGTINKSNEIKNNLNSITYTPDIVCSNGSKIKKDCIYSRYNLDDMKKTKNDTYLFGNTNIPLATDEILSVNAFLSEASALLTYFPKLQIIPNNLYFKERLINGSTAFCFVSFNPLTATGKKPKYPMVLHFYNSNELFGFLCYSQNSEIEKGDIIVWENGICYEVQLRMIGDELKLNTVYQTNPVTYKKQKVYFQ